MSNQDKLDKVQRINRILTVWGAMKLTKGLIHNSLV